MRRLPILKTLVTILFIMSLIMMFFLVPCMLLAIVMPESIPFEINGVPAKDLTIELHILGFIMLIGFTAFIYALYLFKQTLTLFEKRKIFDAAVIKNLDQTGKAIIAGYLICAVPMFLYNMTTDEIKIDLNISFESVFILGLGLFFIVLSEIFLMAKTMKEENDLTV